MINEIDQDGNGEVDFDEFILLMIKVLQEERNQPEELLEVFQAFDVNGDGVVDASDLLKAFKELG